MKRIDGLMPKVCEFQNLFIAAQKAAKNKRKRHATARFFMDLEPELFRLQRELSGNTWRPGPFCYFTIYDPKERTISVAPFRDRVAHHALINIMTPHLEARFDFDSYGCRKNKGMDRALKRAQRFSRKYPSCLKIDIHKFFASVNHESLKCLLEQTYKDRALLQVLNRIIDSYNTGLPLGNLTSQWMANLYLTELDRFLRTSPRVLGQIRYMDDVLIFSKSKSMLQTLLPKIRAFLDTRLKLCLKEKVTQIYATGTGIPFLGFRVFRDKLLVRRDTWQRFQKRVKHKEWEYKTGQCSLDELAASVQSMTAHLRRAATSGLRCAYLEKKQPMEW